MYFLQLDFDPALLPPEQPYVRAANDRWLYGDDALTPRVVPFQEVSDAEAYVHMYERESNEEDALVVPTVDVD